MSRRVVLVGGGVRSGKSSFARARAESLGARRLFVATAQRSDDEMRARIDRHVAERGASFETLEVPLHLPEALESFAGTSAPDVVLVDCLTLWLSNCLLNGDGVDAALARVDNVMDVIARSPFHVVLVTNEVGMGVVPPSELGRAFRDLAGMAHQRIAAAADEVCFAAMGLVLRLKPGSVQVVEPTAD